MGEVVRLSRMFESQYDFLQKRLQNCKERLWEQEGETCNVEFAVWVLCSKLGVWKQRLAMLSYILCPAWSIFTPVGILTVFWLILLICYNRCRKKSLEFVFEMLVTRAFPGRCCGVAVVSRRLLKQQKLSSSWNQIFFWFSRTFEVAWYAVTKRGVIKWWLRFCVFGFIAPDLMWKSGWHSVNKWWFRCCIFRFIYSRAAPVEK